MISSQILQSTIDGLKAITRVDMCVMDTEGNAVASTYSEKNDYSSIVRAFVDSALESQMMQGCYFYKVYDEYRLEYILMVYGTTEESQTIGKDAVFQIQGLLVAYKERFDKDNFVKNL